MLGENYMRVKMDDKVRIIKHPLDVYINEHKHYRVVVHYGKLSNDESDFKMALIYVNNSYYIIDSDKNDTFGWVYVKIKSRPRNVKRALYEC